MSPQVAAGCIHTKQLENRISELRDPRHYPRQCNTDGGATKIKFIEWCMAWRNFLYKYFCIYDVGKSYCRRGKILTRNALILIIDLRYKTSTIHFQFGKKQIIVKLVTTDHSNQYKLKRMQNPVPMFKNPISGVPCGFVLVGKGNYLSPEPVFLYLCIFWRSQ